MTARKSASRRASAKRRLVRQQAQSARHAVYRQLVLEAAEKSFARQGVSGTRMEDLAAEAGLSLGTLYSTYRGKAEIVEALCETHWQEVQAAFRTATPAQSRPLDALLAGVRATVGHFLEHPDALRVEIDEGGSWGVPQATDHASRSAAVWNECVAWLTGIFEQGMAGGVFARGRPDRFARMMLVMQQVRLADWLEEGREEDAGTITRELEILIRRAFCTPAWRDR